LVFYQPYLPRRLKWWGDARWMTKGENPLYLDIYPLFGRDASAEIYVQVDLSGAGPIEADHIEFFLENAQLLPEGYSYDAEVEIIKGDGSGATVQGVLEVFNDFLWDQYTEGAKLLLKMRTSDGGGAEMVYTIGEVGLYGPKDVDPDSMPPGAITEAEINEGNPVSIPANFVDDEFTFPGTVRASDMGKGIQTVALVYNSPIGDFLFLEADMFGLVDGTLNDGLFEGKGEIFPYAEEGIYNLTGAFAEDKYGNSFALPTAQLSAAVQKTVQVINPNADTEPPVLTSPVILDPESVDVTDDAGDILFTFSAMDEGSGLSFGIITAFHKTDTDARPQQAFFAPEEDFLTSGDAQMGIYAVPLTVVLGATPGEYSYQIQLYDNAFRQRTYGSVRPESSLLPESLPPASEEGFSVVNNSVPDLTAPVLNSIVCRTYETGNAEGSGDHNFAAGSGVLEITMTISEPESELAFGSFFGVGSSSFIRVISPTGATDVTRTFGLFDQDFLNPGTYQVEIPLQRAIEPGAYCIEVKLENSSGSNNFYGLNYDSMPFPGDFSGTCQIINDGPVDFAPPVPVDFTVSPNFVPGGTDTTLNVTMRVTDGLTAAGGTGLQSGAIVLQNGIFSSDEFRTPLPESTFMFMPPEDGGTGTGNRYDGTFTFEIPVTAAEIVGDFLSFQINLTDRAGNSRSYDTSICNTNGAQYPLPYHEAQVGAEPDIQPPTITIQPSSQAVVLGGNVSLSVTATGASNITYQWFKDNIAIMNTGSITGATSEILLISNITESNLGVYYVVASSGAESVTSSTATLSVAEEENAGFATYLDSLNVPGNMRGFMDDPDFDGFYSGIEFLMGTNANDASSLPQVTPSTVMVEGEEYFAISFPKNTAITDISLKAEFSSSVEFETVTEGVEVSSETVGDGVERVTQRSTESVGSKKRIFGRFRAGD
jgi:hypothetical protein